MTEKNRGSERGSTSRTRVSDCDESSPLGVGGGWKNEEEAGLKTRGGLKVPKKCASEIPIGTTGWKTMLEGKPHRKRSSGLSGITQSGTNWMNQVMGGDVSRTSGTQKIKFQKGKGTSAMDYQNSDGRGVGYD